MTLPRERYNSLVHTQAFLFSLLDSKLTPRVPRIIRTEARHLLKHYPFHLELEEIARSCPDLLECPEQEITPAKLIARVATLMDWTLAKSRKWFKTPSIHFGGLSPTEMCERGRISKVDKFIKAQEQENGP